MLTVLGSLSYLVMSSTGFRKFLKDYTPLIVGVQLIIGIHWGWLRLQQNEDIVNPEDKRALPIWTVRLIL